MGEKFGLSNNNKIKIWIFSIGNCVSELRLQAIARFSTCISVAYSPIKKHTETSEAKKAWKWKENAKFVTLFILIMIHSVYEQNGNGENRFRITTYTVHSSN